MTMAQPQFEEGEGRTGFLATMSHDIRTPLTAIRGALGLLERENLPPEILEQMVSMLRRSSDRLERLVMGLITIDLIDDGAVSVLREVGDLREIVEDSLSVIRREHPNVQVAFPDDPVEVLHDRERTLQTLDHILDNARKFGGPDGIVRVEVSKREGQGVVRVSDQGPGIAPEYRRRVFERYLQIGERLPNEPRGAGIGLYLARSNAEAMGGSASIVEADEGTTVELSLPLLSEGVA